MNALRVLALAVLRQAFVDAVSDDESLSAEARGFLLVEGKQLLDAMGLSPALVDEYLVDPSAFGSLRVEIADGRGVRRGV